MRGRAALLGAVAALGAVAFSGGPQVTPSAMHGQTVTPHHAQKGGTPQAPGNVAAAAKAERAIQGGHPMLYAPTAGRPWPWWVAAGRRRVTQERKAMRGRS